MDKKFYITTPIYYPSGKLHIGHSYTTVAADTMARYKRMQGFDVMFLTGTDEHGQKIEERAAAAGVTPKAFVDDIVAGIKSMWQLLNITYDKFIRTTDKDHEKTVQEIFLRLYEQGDIYKGSYKGLYCTPCESFWTESQLKDGKCPDCGRDVQESEEEAYFLRLSKYADRLVDYYESYPDFIKPETRKHEMINNFIKPGLEDLCVSRTSFSWGIPVTFDQKHLVYVWLDALSNYISALGYLSEDDSKFKEFWPADIHLVGKEIVRFHTIIWPIMLMALDLPLPKKIFGHGWLLLDGGKMSKSKGNVVDPVVLCNRYGVDAIRYFLLREIPFGNDGVFSNESLITRINSDLANDLGNLASRTAAMVEKYFGGIIPSDRKAGEFDDQLISLGISTKKKVEYYLDNLEFSSALTELFKFISRTNKYIDETAPWVLAKDPSQESRLAAVMYNLCESLRISCILLSPFLPQTSDAIKNSLGGGDFYSWDSADKWGLIPDGTVITKTPPLFPRIDLEKEIIALESLNTVKSSKKKCDVITPTTDNGKKCNDDSLSTTENITTLAQISIEDFAKIELKAARIIACEPIKKAKKLFKLTLDDGSGTDRIVASGIAQWYTPDDLLNHTVVVVANLKPAILCGVESNGMILAANCSDGNVKILFIDDVPCGSKIS